MDHDSFVLFGNAVEGLLNHMTSEGVHAKAQRVTLDRIGYCNNLFRCTVLKAPLNEKVAKTVDHQGISLAHYGLDHIILLFCGTDFELLLKKYRCLLVIVTNDLVHYILPVARDIFVQKSPVV